MKHFWRPQNQRLAWLLGLIVLAQAGRAETVLPATQPVILSLSLAGTNLVFAADFPAGLDQASLEMRPTLTNGWQEAAQLEVPTNGGVVEFSLPQPALEMAFFRLNVTFRANTPAAQSGELQYVAMPSLASAATNAGAADEAVFHFKGEVDGSDRIVITHEGALWQHVNWGWPAGVVTINDTQWNPLEKNFMTSTGALAFLPAKYSLAAVKLEVLAGRDVVALERTNNALIVYLDDTPLGAAPYEFKIHFYPATNTPAKWRTSTVATLKIAAPIDGSDRLKITANEATWTHVAWGPPEAVKLNDVVWRLNQTNVLANAGTNRFLPPGVDFSTARIVERQGRDLATAWADDDALWVTFADNPNGGDDYELEISFGEELRP